MSYIDYYRFSVYKEDRDFYIELLIKFYVRGVLKLNFRGWYGVVMYGEKVGVLV